MSDEAEQSGAGGDGRVRRSRRRRSEARKRRIVAESYQPGVSVSVVARRHDVNANRVFGWRRQYRELARAVGGFVPAVVSSTEGAERATLLPAPTDTEPSASGRIEIALADGSRVTVDRDMDASALSRLRGQPLLGARRVRLPAPHAESLARPDLHLLPRPARRPASAQLRPARRLRTSRSSPALLDQRRSARRQQLLKRFLTLTSDAERYYAELQQRRLNAIHHIRKIVALSEIHGVENTARALADALHFGALGSEYIENLLESRARLTTDPGPLHLTRQTDALELDLPDPDLADYDRHLEPEKNP